MHNYNSLACTNTAPLCSEDCVGSESWGSERKWPLRVCPGAQVKRGRGASERHQPLLHSLRAESQLPALHSQKCNSKALELTPTPSQSKVKREVGLC